MKNTIDVRRRSETSNEATVRRRDGAEEKGGLDLSQFYGTDKYYKHPFSRVVYTDGVQYFAQNAGGGAYWFLDECVINFATTFKNQEFLAITLEVKDGTGDVVVTDGNETTLIKKHYAYTDCPNGTYKFYLTDDVLMLASEY